MKSLCFIVIDGVLADTSARYSRAQDAADARWGEDQRGSKYHDSSKWATFFQSALVELDTLASRDARQWLDLYESLGYRIIFISTRPEHMRRATLEWLDAFGLLTPDRTLYLKPAAFQYTKSPIWIAGTVAQIAYAAVAEEVLIFNNESAWEQEIKSHTYTFKITLEHTTPDSQEEEPAEEEEDVSPF